MLKASLGDQSFLNSNACEGFNRVNMELGDVEHKGVEWFWCVKDRELFAVMN
jgi:hypothetical protein